MRNQTVVALLYDMLANIFLLLLRYVLVVLQALQCDNFLGKYRNDLNLLHKNTAIFEFIIKVTNILRTLHHTLH